jgi:hypothetical protein
MSQEGAYQFIGKPKTYSGVEGQGISAKAWLKSLQRIKDGMDFDDSRMLWIAASNLSGIALMWWDTNEDDVTTWIAFMNAFSSQFIAGNNKDHLWHELKTLKQENRSVDELGFRLMELFSYLGIKDEETRTRYLESALHPDLALALEARDDLDDFKACLNYVKKMERLKKKYGSCISNQSVNSGSSVTSVSTMEGLSRSFGSMNVNMVKPPHGNQGNHEDKTGRPATVNGNTRSGGGGRPCFICEELGHFAIDCHWKAKIKELKNTNGDGNADSGKGLDRQ